MLKDWWMLSRCFMSALLQILLYIQLLTDDINIAVQCIVIVQPLFSAPSLKIEI